jgi:predicted RNase H-like HicB family nuclease
MRKQLTAIIEREGSGYVSLCAELDIASPGATVEEARDNLREAPELFFETASEEEIAPPRPKSAVETERLIVGGPLARAK